MSEISKIRRRLNGAILAAWVLASCPCGADDPVGGWKHIPLDRVKVGGRIGSRIGMTVSNNLMRLDLKGDFVRPFSERSGKVTFVGTGNALEAFVKLARHTGDKAVERRKNELIDLLLATQLPSGYIGLMPEGKRYWSMWDLEDIGFILDGLVADWRLFGSVRSLEAAKKAADDAIAHWGKGFPKDWDAAVYDKELMMGLGHGIYSLYLATGNAAYRDFVAETRGYLTNDMPVVVGRDYGIRGQADGYLDVCYTQLEMYLKERDPRLLRQTKRAFEHLFRQDGMLITGATGVAECWSGDQDGCGYSGETCFAAEALVVYDYAIRTGMFDVAELGAAMERTLHNAFFAAQSENGRKLRYYTPFTGERYYWPSDVYCCPGNFRRTVGNLPQYVLYVNSSGVLANLYTEAKASVVVDDAKVGIVEHTDYPRSGRVAFEFDAVRPTKFDFAVRIPEWCREPVVKVNGRLEEGVTPRSVFTIRRVWKTGDRIELDFPMDIRLVAGRCRQKGRVAVMRGPVVYSLDTRTLLPIYGNHTWDELQRFPTSPLELEGCIMLNPRSLRLAADGESIAAQISVLPYELGFKADQPGDHLLTVTLRPFADPSGTLTYFRVPDVTSVGQPDGLVQLDANVSIPHF